MLHVVLVRSNIILLLFFKTSEISHCLTSFIPCLELHPRLMKTGYKGIKQNTKFQRKKRVSHIVSL